MTSMRWLWVSMAAVWLAAFVVLAYEGRVVLVSWVVWFLLAEATRPRVIVEEEQ